MTPLWPRLFKPTLISAALAFGLSACGGGGSSADTTPDTFSFQNQSGVDVATQLESEAVTITGIDAGTPISIQGGEYCINGGAYTREAGTIDNGQTLQVRALSSDEFSTESTAQITVGDMTVTVAFTTEAQDIEPDVFSFAGVDANPNSTVISAPITITGINDTVELRIEGGDYRINGGDFTREAGTVVAGDEVEVQLTAAATLGETATAELFIAGLSDSFVVTSSDVTAPTALVVFPTPTTLTEGTQVTLRGKGEDDFSAISSLHIDVTTDDGAHLVQSYTLTPQESDDFLVTWSQQVDLAEGKVNTIQVTATDSAGNIQPTPTELNITQQTEMSTFPESEAAFDWYVDDSASEMVVDQEHNQLLVPGYHEIDPILTSINLTTGAVQELIAANETYGGRNGLEWDQEAGIFYLTSYTPAILTIDQNSYEMAVLVDETVIDNSEFLRPKHTKIIDSDNMYITDYVRGLKKFNLSEKKYQPCVTMKQFTAPAIFT